jgi:hypothetical protein
MTALHEPGISRTRKISGYALSIFASLAVLGSGLLKFTSSPDILALLEQLGLADHLVLIGLVEIAVVLVYWIPRTSNLGFFLFCSYVGGITIAELILGQVPIPGLAIGALVYVGTLLRKPALLG